MSLLVDNGYMLDCWLRGSDQNIKFDIRFMDTKTTDPEDHPWRMGITVDGTLIDWNGQWQNLKIPLKEFTEQGSWDNGAWFDPTGSYDWTATDRLEIVAEHMDLTGIEIFFDAIRITDSVPTSLYEDKSIPHADNDLLSIYPNPSSGIFTLRFKVLNPGPVEISVFDLSGQLLRTVVHDNMLPGFYTVDLDIEHEEAGRIGAGIYLCRMVTSGRIEIDKIIKSRF
jgi:endoglucanase